MSLFVASWFAAVVVFRSSLVILLILLLDGVPLWVSINRLLCCLIVGIQASGMSIPLFLLMLLGWSLKWIAPFTLLVYQWESRSINLTLLQIRICPISALRSRRGLSMSKPCVSVMFFYPFSHWSPCFNDIPFAAFNGILWTTPFCFVGSRASLGRTKWDLSVVSNLKMVCMPWCCRQRRRTSDTPVFAHT